MQAQPFRGFLFEEDRKLGRASFARKMREIFRLNDFRVKQGLDIIIVIRGKANYCTYQQIEEQYLNLLNRHHIFMKDAEAQKTPDA